MSTFIVNDSLAMRESTHDQPPGDTHQRRVRELAGGPRTFKPLSCHKDPDHGAFRVDAQLDPGDSIVGFPYGSIR